MEVALIISSIAGVATAATIGKIPKKKVPLVGANTHIKSQIDTLRIEKEILTKTISRLYTDGSDLTKVQRDKLLLRYQHQLGVILAKIEKLEEASRHPDLGPLGDGLITLMDQKLSSLDKRLTEISTKISVAQLQLEKPVQKTTQPTQKQTETPRRNETQSSKIDEIIQSFAKPATKLEITTLTEIPENISVKPVEIKPTVVQVQPMPQTTVAEIAEPQVQPQIKQEFVQDATEEPLEEEIVEAIQPRKFITEPIDVEKQVKSEPPKLEFREPEAEKKKPKINIPEPEIDDDVDDLDSIKREIMKTLSKLEQAEVE
jgi:hypothetical protein